MTDETSIIDENCMLYVTRRGDELGVYRSVIVEDDDEVYRAARQLTEGGTLVHRDVVADEDMVFGAGELLVYSMPPRNLAAA